jgi:GNAT superfamily N-acetyltransferase
MANVVIDRIDPKDTETIAHLYNQMFRPSRTAESFARRFLARHNVLALVARIGPDAVGFNFGLEHKPSVHFAWLCGVVPEMRRTGIATQLMHTAMDWAKTEAYTSVRFECHNQHRAFLHFGISEGFDIVGIRWDPDSGQNLVIFEKLL